MKAEIENAARNLLSARQESRRAQELANLAHRELLAREKVEEDAREGLIHVLNSEGSRNLVLGNVLIRFCVVDRRLWIEHVER